MKSRRVRLVTIAGPRARADLAVAADAPITHLLPVLAQALGVDDPAGRLTLWTPDQRPLLRNRTLDEQGVHDGVVLTLSSAAPPAPESA